VLALSCGCSIDSRPESRSSRACLAMPSSTPASPRSFLRSNLRLPVRCIGILSGSYRDPIGLLLRFYRDPIGILSGSSIGLRWQVVDDNADCELPL